MRFILALIAASAFAVTPAMAQDSGFYIGAGFGEMAVEVNDVEGEDVRFDDSATTWKVLGGYRFMEYLAAEVEYIDSGDAEDSVDVDLGDGVEEVDLTVGINGWNASLVGILPFAERWNVFAKLGFLMWDADIEVEALGDSFRGTDDGTDFSWGIGGGFDFTENFGAVLEYQSFEVTETDVALLSASLLWKF